MTDLLRNLILTVAYELRIDRAVAWVADRLDRRRDEQVVMTHTDPSRFVPGDRFERGDGAVFRLTRVVQVSRTRLFDGGSAPCWQVRGVRLTDEEQARD